MAYYQSAVDSGTGHTSGNGGDFVSPSAAFDDGYVPFTMTPGLYGQAPSGLYQTNASDFGTGAGEPVLGHDSRPHVHNTGTANHNYAIVGELDNNCAISSPLNHDESRSPPRTSRAPPNSPINDVVTLGQHLLPGSLPPLESRRPGRPRGGRLPEIEQYYRAVAQLNHGQSHNIPGFVPPNPAFPHQLDAPTFGQGAGQPFGQAGGGPGYNMVNQAHHGLPDAGPVNMGRGSGGLAPFRPHLGSGDQQQPGSVAGFAGFSGFSSTAGGDHLGQLAPPVHYQYGNHDSANANTNTNNNNYQYHAPTQSADRSQSAGPSQPSGPPQFAAAPLLTGLPPLHPGQQVPQSSTAHEQPQQRLSAPPSQHHIPPPMAVFHDLPPSVTERPTFQRMLKQATAPENLPPNLTPEQAQLIQQTQIHAAKAKFDKVREANNKSAKRGRYKRMATTVALADEVMRQKAELARLQEDNEEMQHKIEMVERVMPGLTTGDDTVQGGQSTGLQQHGGGNGTGPTSSFFDQQSSDDFHATGPASSSNALGITMPPMTDLFGSPLPQAPQAGEASSSTQANLPATSQTTAAAELPFTLALPATATSSSPSSRRPPAAAAASLALDRGFLREAHEMRLQLVDALRGDKLHDLGFGCHDEVDAVVQRGRRIREMLGLADDDWDRWSAAPAAVGRRKRAISEVDGEDEDEASGAAAKKKKKGKQVVGRA